MVNVMMKRWRDANRRGKQMSYRNTNRDRAQQRKGTGGGDRRDRCQCWERHLNRSSIIWSWTFDKWSFDCHFVSLDKIHLILKSSSVGHILYLLYLYYICITWCFPTLTGTSTKQRDRHRETQREREIEQATTSRNCKTKRIETERNGGNTETEMEMVRSTITSSNRITTPIAWPIRSDPTRTRYWIRIRTSMSTFHIHTQISDQSDSANQIYLGRGPCTYRHSSRGSRAERPTWPADWGAWSWLLLKLARRRSDALWDWKGGDTNDTGWGACDHEWGISYTSMCFVCECFWSTSVRLITHQRTLVGIPQLTFFPQPCVPSVQLLSFLFVEFSQKCYKNM